MKSNTKSIRGFFGVFVLVLSLMMAGGASLSNAATVTTVSCGTNCFAATAVSDLVVGSLGTFDVVFKWGTFSDIFGATPDFTGSDAGAARTALINAFNTNSPVPHFVFDQPGRTMTVQYLIPESAISTLSILKQQVWEEDGSFVLPGGPPGTENMFAKFSAVPVPAAAWLFLSAIGGLGIIKRSRS